MRRSQRGSGRGFGVAFAAAALLAACAGQARPPDDSPPPSATAADGPTVEPTRSTPTASPEPEPTPIPAQLVWFSPNMGSTDHVELFADPDAWTPERELIDVFHFHSQVLFPDPCSICGQNALDAFAEADAFEQLHDWGVTIGVGVGAVYEDGCDGAANFHRDAGVVIQNVEANGGAVGFLVMDEPLLHGGSKPVAGSCDYASTRTAVEVAAFVSAVRTARPGITVGLVEPYPHFSAQELQEWVVELERNGVALPFFQLDVDTERVRVDGSDVAADLRSLRDFCEARGIAFGVILTSNWTEADSNRTYYKSTMDWLRTVQAAIGKPPHVIFQSWQGPAPSGDHEVPVNLARNDPDGFSHLALLREGLDVFDAPRQ